MKPIVQVPLTILVVAVLIFIMYSQSKKSEEDEKSASDPVQSHETSHKETAERDMPEDEVAEKEVVEEDEEVAALDAIVDDEPDTEETSQPSPKKAAKDQAKRAPANLREHRRRMFKKIDTGEKDNIASKEEHDRFFRKAFQFYDKNDDGRLTSQELKQVKRLPRKADVNKDGILTRKEFLDQFERFFAIMDKDKSGDLTELEFVR